MTHSYIRSTRSQFHRLKLELVNQVTIPGPRVSHSYPPSGAGVLDRGSMHSPPLSSHASNAPKKIKWREWGRERA